MCRAGTRPAFTRRPPRVATPAALRIQRATRGLGRRHARPPRRRPSRGLRCAEAAEPCERHAPDELRATLCVTPRPIAPQPQPCHTGLRCPPSTAVPVTHPAPATSPTLSPGDHSVRHTRTTVLTRRRCSGARRASVSTASDGRGQERNTVRTSAGGRSTKTRQPVRRHHLGRTRQRCEARHTRQLHGAGEVLIHRGDRCAQVSRSNGEHSRQRRNRTRPVRPDRG